ncbi:MAG: putative phosphoribosyl-dephospho-CoA transferase [Herminiimonas sp.]|nr:putative phosphoribosyl-dephospho-CoA transferase [Herminiimonas sp.]
MLARHNLVWLSEAGWETAGYGRPELEQKAMRRWRDNAWPAVARRAERSEGSNADTGDDDSSDSAETAWLALSLPPDPVSGSKPRVGFHVARGHVLRVSAPLMLNLALNAAPSAWQSELQALDAEATAMGLRFHAFGSLAWQAITGLQHLGPRSDIDLLWYPRTRHELDAGLNLLSSHAEALPLDGEIIFPDGNGVAWKEWVKAERESALAQESADESEHHSAQESAHSAHASEQGSGLESAHNSRIALPAPRVLAKAMRSVRLVARTDLIASLGEVACPR